MIAKYKWHLAAVALVIFTVVAFKKGWIGKKKVTDQAPGKKAPIDTEPVVPVTMPASNAERQYVANMSRAMTK